MLEFKDKVPAEDVSALEAIVTEAKAALESNDADSMKAAHEKLTKESYRLTEAMYKKAGAAGAANGHSEDSAKNDNASAKDEGVVDADFEEMGKQ